MTDNNNASKGPNAWIAIDLGLSAAPKLGTYPIAAEPRDTRYRAVIEGAEE